MNISFLKIIFSFLLLISCISPNIHAEHAATQLPDFFVLTIPKSGSHLMFKLLKIMTRLDHQYPRVPNMGAYYFLEDSPQTVLTDEQIDAILSRINRAICYPFGHTNYSPIFMRYYQRHTHAVPVLLVRDLRDALVSCVFFSWNDLEHEIGPSTFDKKLSYLINMRHDHPSPNILNLYRHAEHALVWLDNPSVLLFRFEDLVGEEGGGSRHLQEKNITILANALGIPLSAARLNYITRVLFGKDEGPQMPTTFREGKIGKWKKHFKPHHIADFKKKWGHLQKAFGYSL